MKVSGILVGGGVGLLVAAGGGGYGWHAWTCSPTYSLKQLAAAVERRDRYDFEKYVDVDAVLRSFISDAADGNAMATAIGGAAIPQLKGEVIKAIEDGAIPESSRVGQGVQKSLRGGLPKIDRQGRNAYFTVPITTKGGAPFSLQIHMTQVPDGYWRVDRLANVKELHAAEEAEEKARKAAIAKANDEQLAKLVVVAKLHTSVQENWYSRKNRFQIRFENRSDKEIARMTGHIRLPAHEFNHGIRGDIGLAPGQQTNGVWSFDVNRFMEDTERVYRLGETDEFDLDVDSLTFADGTTVRRGSEEP
ncbi:MAG: hypothetical protein KF819_18325 [Labilithrix sp.]|nr:hypothetical protein [Labilithrix sp.]